MGKPFHHHCVWFFCSKAKASGQDIDHLDFKIVVEPKDSSSFTVILVASSRQEKAAWTSDISQVRRTRRVGGRVLGTSSPRGFLLSCAHAGCGFGHSVLAVTLGTQCRPWCCPQSVAAVSSMGSTEHRAPRDSRVTQRVTHSCGAPRAMAKGLPVSGSSTRRRKVPWQGLSHQCSACTWMYVAWISPLAQTWGTIHTYSAFA